MRPSGGNSLDLNNFPEDFGGKHGFEESSTTTAASMDNKGESKKKKKETEKDDKIYECRFCSLKFCKSQALGGHMNRHRQERENETLNRARQLVFSNDNITGVGTQIGLNDLSFGNSSMQAGMPSNFNFGHVYPRIPNPSSHSAQHLHPSTIYSSSSSSPPYYQSPLIPSSSSPAAAAAAAAAAASARLSTVQQLPPHQMSHDHHYYHGRLPASGSTPSNYSCFGSEGMNAIGRNPNMINGRNIDCGNWNVGSTQRSTFVHRSTAEPSSFDRFRDGI